MNSVHYRNIEIRKSIVVVVGGDYRLRKSGAIDAGCGGDVLECAITAVAKKLHGSIFIGHDQVDESVVVNVRPHCRLGTCGGFRETALVRHVRECAVAIVAQK